MGFILIKLTPDQAKQNHWFSTTEGFCQAFEINLRDTRTATAPFTAAYELTEHAHEELFGRRKYSSYQSFRTATTKKKGG